MRLETRFAAGRRELRIRIYPEPIHKDDHETELTEAELAAGQEYWRARWAAAEDPSARRSLAAARCSNCAHPAPAGSST